MLKEIIDKCKVLIKFFQDHTISMLEERSSNLSLEILCAYCNNCQNSFDYIDELQARVDEVLGEEVVDFSESKDGFSDAAMRCVNFIASAAIPYTGEFYSKLFRDEWYQPGPDGRLISCICSTFESIFNDIKEWLEENWYFRTVSKVLEKAANKYVEILLDKKTSVKIEFKCRLSSHCPIGKKKKLINYDIIFWETKSKRPRNHEG